MTNSAKHTALSLLSDLTALFRRIRSPHYATLKDISCYVEEYFAFAVPPEGDCDEEPAAAGYEERAHGIPQNVAPRNRPPIVQGETTRCVDR